MSNSEEVEAGEKQMSSRADQHGGSAPEAGTFTTDEAPTSDTEGHGSSDPALRHNQDQHP